jgi:hypothetical protein
MDNMDRQPGWSVYSEVKRAPHCTTVGVQEYQPDYSFHSRGGDSVLEVASIIWETSSVLLLQAAASDTGYSSAWTLAKDNTRHRRYPSVYFSVGDAWRDCHSLAEV